ncbi:hypothetical protein H0I23_06380 [Cellulophaga sp. HaHaR_3_176]|uniref:hypothetical protein n=1 Tax=Cellulophaga sp. HaHaR_3_176 TaxID=1942464 RepID=UPI001C1FC432|nr:hypothetical protein [Cellulophaga sp. HaHaR_3_176]QWX85260.1 hypothetical protein H0I23_06380 [Cellulophaga sp. HaHaR_3_176]
MGWDISYHPISESQIQEWYFNVLEDQNLIDKLSKEYKIEDFYKEKYSNAINYGLEIKKSLEEGDTAVFEKNHGFFIAVVQGFFQQYFYTRGSALSFSESGLLEKYFKKWNDILLDKQQLKSEFYNRISENYSSGVYIPKDKVVELLKDYETDSDLKEELDSLFSYSRIDVFLKALNFAKNNDLGVLEATEVVEPFPFDLNNSSSYSNLFNCDIDGPLLYQQAAMGQIAEIEKNENLEEGKISSKIEYKVVNIEPKKEEEKKGFWKKLFGK